MYQHGVVRCLTNRDGWSNQWKKRMSSPMVTAPKVGAPLAPTAQYPTPKTIGLSCDGITDRLAQGDQCGIRLFESFLFESGQPYTKYMSSPVTAFDACSRLSHTLPLAPISIRHVFQIASNRQKKFRPCQKAPKKRNGKVHFDHF